MGKGRLRAPFSFGVQMAKKKSVKGKSVSLKKLVSSLEKKLNEAEKEQEMREKWKNPGARIDEKRFF